MRFVTYIVREHQLWLYGHVARFPDADPAHQILSVRDCCVLRLVLHTKEIGMGQASAWGMARRTPLAEKWTQRYATLAHAPIPDLT